MSFHMPDFCVHSDPMRITGFNPVRSASTKRVSSSTRTGSFDEVLASASEQMHAAAQVSDAAPIASLDQMLALQEISDEESRRRTLVKQGEMSLEALDKLRSALLMGVLPQSTLRQLEKVVAQQRAVAAPDPRLASILDEIELRAAVELAKLEMARPQE